MFTRGKESARTIRRADTLLLALEGKTDEEIAEVLRCSPDTVAGTRRAFDGRGLKCLYDRPQPGQKRKLDGRSEAHLVALAFSNAPEGRSRWTMQALVDEMVFLGHVDSISDDTIRRVLKKIRNSSPG
jgi:transposase